MKKTARTIVNDLPFALLALLMWMLLVNGCSTKPQETDPLVDWQVEEVNQPDQAIINDYQAYVKQLPPKIRFYVQSPFWFLKDGTGQHAIRFEVPIGGKYYEHVLIYDKSDKRIKVVVYSGGRYES